MITKEVIIIAPKKAKSTTKLTCVTSIAGKRFVLTKNWKIILESQLGKGEFVNEKIMDISFTPANGSFRFAFDLHPEREKPAEKDKVDDMAWSNEREIEKDKYNAAFNFFAKHQQMQVAGMDNPYLKGEPMFVMSFTNHVSVNNCNRTEKVVRAYQKVASMTLQEKLNLTLYFMPSLYGKRHSQIMDTLTNLETGLLLKPPYIDQLLDYDSSNVAVAMHTYVNKAMQMNILEHGANGYYLPGGVFVGSDTPEIVGYFLKDAASYNNVLVKQVNKMEKLPEDDLVFRDEDLGKRLAIISDYQRNADMAPEEWRAQMEQTRAEARAAGVKNVENSTWKTLKDEIERIKSGGHKYISPHKAILAAEIRGVDTLGGEKIEDLKVKSQELEDLKMEMKAKGIKGWHLVRTIEQAKMRLAMPV